MRAVIQRVSQASVTVEGREIACIGRGLLVLGGFRPEDTSEDLQYVARKIAGLRVFADEAGRMNRDVLEVGGQILLVPNFTLYADIRKGKRPGFSGAASPEVAAGMLTELADTLRNAGPRVQLGEFGAHMHVQLTNDGPVTIILESEAR